MQLSYLLKSTFQPAAAAIPDTDIQAPGRIVCRSHKDPLFSEELLFVAQTLIALC